MAIKRQPQRVGILGGTFDPPHIGHLALARTSIEALRLDQLLVVPAGDPWQKKNLKTPATHRLAMTERCFSALPAVKVDSREATRPGPSYSIDTLMELRQENPHAALVLVLGSDQFRNLNTWHRWSELLEFSHIAVTQREQVSLQELPPEIEACLSTHGAQHLGDDTHGHIVFFSMPPVAVSSSGIRQALAQRSPATEPVRELVPASVLDYIKAHRLYEKNE